MLAETFAKYCVVLLLYAPRNNTLGVPSRRNTRRPTRWLLMQHGSCSANGKLRPLTPHWCAPRMHDWVRVPGPCGTLLGAVCRRCWGCRWPWHTLRRGWCSNPRHQRVCWQCWTGAGASIVCWGWQVVRFSIDYVLMMARLHSSSAHHKCCCFPNPSSTTAGFQSLTQPQWLHPRPPRPLP